jgi:ectoine hydroxylase-related dioxygenase (phytanoyl-CoA dioxygenase family)
MPYQSLTATQKAQYDNDGYLIIPNFLAQPEVDLLYNLATKDDILRSNAFDLNDQAGKRTKLTLWFTPGDDTFSLLTRSERMVRSVQSLLGDGEVCHFHSKLMQKEPKVGGAWEWHQDYGYWYKNGFLYPDALISVMLALTEATKENGCLQST